VTGAGQRIGRALALAAAESGFDVIVHFRGSAEPAAETVALIERIGRRATLSKADL
jgi:NAD(P)-dependent dehydrogenase (short-subunit alcohol dehydrogenase family)